MPAPLLSTSESSYILSGLQSDPPFRHDRRSLTEFRELHLQTGVAAQANGSARVTIGGTTVLVGIKAEVEDVDGEGKEDDDEAAGDGVEFGKEASGSGARVVCSIEWYVHRRMRPERYANSTEDCLLLPMQRARISPHA